MKCPWCEVKIKPSASSVLDHFIKKHGDLLIGAVQSAESDTVRFYREQSEEAEGE